MTPPPVTTEPPGTLDPSVNGRSRREPEPGRGAAGELPDGGAIPGGQVEWRAGDQVHAGDRRRAGRTRGGVAGTATTAGRSSKGRAGRVLRRAVGPLALLAFWQILSSSGVIDTRTLPSPWQVLDTGYQLCAAGTLPNDLLVSLRRLAEGIALGLTVGIVFGVISGLWRLGEEMVDSTMQMLRTVPFVALWPLLIVWFGIGETPKIVLVAFATSFPVYINVYAGIRNVDAKLIESARVVGLRTRSLLRHVVLPGALPQALVGLRLSLGIAVVALVAAESINATSGIGYLMQNAEQFVQTNVILVGLVVYALMGLSADLLVRILERLLLPWRQSFSGR